MKKSRLLCAVRAYSIAMCISTNVDAATVSGQGTWETTLEGRDLDGNAATFEAYYDTVLDITWLADANYAESSGYAAGVGTYSDGRMTWNEALTWVDQLTIGGFSEWRLPSTPQRDPTCDSQSSHIINGRVVDAGYNCSSSEMGFLFFEELGNLAMFDGQTLQPDYGLTSAGPFQNLAANIIWSGSSFPGGSPKKWYFDFHDGLQEGASSGIYAPSALAVADGDPFAPVPVPVPAAAWLFGSGLVCLIGVARGKVRV